MTELLIHISARFLVNHSDATSYKVQLYDKDVLKDDFLEEVNLEPDGTVRFTVNPVAYRTTDSKMERHPDFYMVLLKNEEEIFRTPTAENIDLENEGHFDSQAGLELDLGEFLITA